MEASLQKTTSILLDLGSILFLIATFLPYSRVFIESDPEKKLSIINSMPNLWNVGHVLFGSGAMLTAIALGLFSYGNRDLPGTTWAFAGVALILTGAVLWNWHVAERIIHPESFARGTHTPYLFLIYSIFTQIGLVFMGILLLNTVLPNWAGWMFISGGAVLFLLMLLFRDMPPFVYYMIMIVVSVVMHLNVK